MWKSILLLVLAIAVTSCGAKRKGVEASKDSREIVLGKNPTVSYKSLGNGVASISLQLYENNTFLFNFNSIPQPGTDEKPVKILEKGTYTSEGNWKILNFEDPKFSLAAIFDTDYSAGNDFKVMDEDNVKINTSKKVLSIWGVMCEKE